MTRNPSVHIKKSDLIKVFKYFDIDVDISLFMRKCLDYPSNRRYYVRNVRVKKDLPTIFLDEFIQRLYVIRRAKGEFAARIYSELESDYVKIKNICKNIKSFQNQYNIKDSDLIDTYIHLYYNISKKFSLIDMIKNHNNIIEKFGEIREVDKYENKKLALDILAIYCYLAEVPAKSTFESNKLAFVRCAKDVENKYDEIAWVKSQIDYFKNYSLVISPNILYGSQALKRYNQMYKEESTNELRNQIFR